MRPYYPNIMDQTRSSKGLPVGMTADAKFIALPRSVRKRFQDLLDAAAAAQLHPKELQAFANYVLNYAVRKNEGVQEHGIIQVPAPDPEPEQRADT